MTMLSARIWNANRSPWRALVSWLWLSSLVFSAATSDCFHAATCPEQALLRWKSRAGHAAVSSGTLPGAATDIACAACALANAMGALLVARAHEVARFGFALAAKPFARVNAAFLPALPIARGPPASAAFELIREQGRCRAHFSVRALNF